MPIAVAQQRNHVRHGVDSTDQHLARRVDVRSVAQGSRDACERLLLLLQGGKTPGQVDTVVVDWSPRGEAISGFTER